MEIHLIRIDKADDVNVIAGQSHFIKTVEDLHEVLAMAGGGLRFGVAFCEASGPRLIRRSGNDPDLVDMATRAAQSVAAGHLFVIMLRDGFPVSVLNAVKQVPEVCTVFCATANPVSLIVVEDDGARGVAGVIDGESPLGVESAQDEVDRRALLRAIGYKL
ncbi:MAG: adenosine-specific kinase [Acidimicrobiales bacterium]